MVKTVEPERARQGRSGNRVLMILIGGLVLAMIGWAGVEIFGEATDESATELPGQIQTQPAEPGQVPGATPPAPQN